MILRKIALRRRLNLFGSKYFSSTATAEDLEKKFIVSTYATNGVRGEQGLVLDHGEGSWIFSESGKKYLDMAAGIAVSVLGHGDKDVQKAVSDQIIKLAHASNIYHNSPALRVAEKLINLSPGMSKVFFTNSGTEANEGAIKFAKIYSNLAHLTPRTKFIAFEGSFHGRSLGSLSLTYKPKIRLPFNGLTMPNVVHLPFNDISALEKEFKNSSEVNQMLGVIVEPVQGEGGINPATPEFMKKLRELCDKHDAVLIFDEVQIGFGRVGSGKFWGYEIYDNVVPDILTCAKPIAAGLPMGAILLSDNYISKVTAQLKDKSTNAFLGLHGSTFAGNPVCCSAAEVVLNKMSEPGFLTTVAETGEYFIKQLVQLQGKFPDLIQRVNRPIGDKSLYAGLKVSVPVDKLLSRGIKRGLLVLSAGDYNNVVRICPPLIISKAEVDVGVKILSEVFDEFRKDNEVVALSFVATSDFSSREEFETFVKSQAVLPKGFSSASTRVEFRPKELGPSGKIVNMGLSVMKLDKPSTSYAALFTKNKLPGAPVKVGKEIVSSRTPISAILVNTKVSNVHPRGGGVHDAKVLMEAVKTSFNLDHGSTVFPSSTGVIGWGLPVAEMKASIATLNSKLNSDPVAGFEFAKHMMTTDNYPKASTVELCFKDVSGKTVSLGRITGFAKGAGMIEPNLGLATMLVFILTDIDVSKAGFKKTLQDHLSLAVNVPGSFNRISIDSDQSTSDTVLLISSSSSQDFKGVDSDVLEKKFQAALQQVCTSLAHHVVRNGEGVDHVIKAKIVNAPNEFVAKIVGRRIINSPLVKTAIAGNDPNVGRILAAVGNALSDFDESLDLSKLEIRIGDSIVFRNQEFSLDGDVEAKLVAYFKAAQQDLHVKHPTHGRTIDITVDFSASIGSYTTEFIGADLTHGYVKENASYRS